MNWPCCDQVWSVTSEFIAVLLSSYCLWLHASLIAETNTRDSMGDDVDSGVLVGLCEERQCGVSEMGLEEDWVRDRYDGDE